MEKIWLKQYPAGVPANIDVEQYPSLVALLEESLKKYAAPAGLQVHGQDDHLRAGRRGLARAGRLPAVARAWTRATASRS